MQAILTFLNASGLLHNALFAPLALILGDFLTGFCSSLKNKTFDFNQLMNVLGSNLKPGTDVERYVNGVIVYLVASGTHLVPQDILNYVGGTGALLICVPVLKSIFDNLIELLPTSWQPEARVLASEFEAAVQADLTPVQPAPAPVQAPLAADQMATVSVPAVSVDLSGGTAVQNMGLPVQVQFQPQFKMPSGLVTQG